MLTFGKNFLLFNFFQKTIFYHKKLSPLKPIFTLLTWGQICIVLAVEPFEIKNFDLGHPVGPVHCFRNIFHLLSKTFNFEHCMYTRTCFLTKTIVWDFTYQGKWSKFEKNTRNTFSGYHSVKLCKVLLGSVWK